MVGHLKLLMLAAPLIGGLAVAAPLTQQVPSAQPAVLTDAQRAVSAQLASLINTETARLAPTATAEDYEAAIIFVLGQGDNRLPVMLEALDQVAAQPNLSPVMRQGLANARIALLRRFQRGTAALREGVGFGFGGTGGGFGGAIIGIGGGGGSNYGS